MPMPSAEPRSLSSALMLYQGANKVSVHIVFSPEVNLRTLRHQIRRAQLPDFAPSHRRATAEAKNYTDIAISTASEDVKTQFVLYSRGVDRLSGSSARPERGSVDVRDSERRGLEVERQKSSSAKEGLLLATHRRSNDSASNVQYNAANHLLSRGYLGAE